MWNLNLVTDQAAGGTTTIPCPNKSCTLRQYIKGRVRKVSYVDAAGKSVPYDWDAPKTRIAHALSFEYERKN
jgi:hypothetical protein